MAVLKNVGKGILYIIGLPFFLIVLALTALMGIFMLIFMFFKSIILFFTGRSLDDDLPEDIKVKEIKSGGKKTTTSTDNQETPVSNNEPIVEPYVATTNNQSPIEQAVFGHQIYQEPVAQEETIEEPVFEEEPATPEVPPMEEPVSSIDIDESPVGSNTTEISIGQYVPHTSGSRFIDDEEEEEEDSGVDIFSGDDDD